MKYISDNYLNFTDSVIVGSNGFNEADYCLSFSLRDENNKVVAYISLKHEKCHLYNEMNGCRISDMYVERTMSKEKFSAINTSLLDRLYQEAHMRIVAWSTNGVPNFSYIWFKLRDFDASPDLVDYLNNEYFHKDDIVIIPIKR